MDTEYLRVILPAIGLKISRGVFASSEFDLIAERERNLILSTPPLYLLFRSVSTVDENTIAEWSTRYPNILNKVQGNIVGGGKSFFVFLIADSVALDAAERLTRLSRRARVINKMFVIDNEHGRLHGTFPTLPIQFMVFYQKLTAGIEFGFAQDAVLYT